MPVGARGPSNPAAGTHNPGPISGAAPDPVNGRRSGQLGYAAIELYFLIGPL